MKQCDRKSTKEARKEEYRRQSWPFLLAFFMLTLACIVFSILCINGTRIIFLQRHTLLFTACSIVLICILCVLSVWSVLACRDTMVKALLSAYILLLFVLVLIYIFQRTGFFEVVKTPDKLQAYLEKAGIWMPVLYIVLQYLQVILLPIPSVVSTVAGVALFGPLKTIFFSLIGILAGSLTAFFIGRKLGYKAVAWIVGKDTLDKWQKKLKKKDNFLLTVMFILPMFPDDVLCFVAGLSSMSNRYFVLMILFARIIGIVGTCYSFDFIPLNEWWGLLVWVILLIAIFLIVFLIYKNMDSIQKQLENWKKRKKRK